MATLVIITTEESQTLLIPTSKVGLSSGLLRRCVYCEMPPGPINVRTPSKCAKEAFEPHKLVVVVGLFYYASTSYHCLSIVTP